MTARLSEETKLRDQIVARGRSIFDRGLTGGSTGNISVRLNDGSMLMTPTNASLANHGPIASGTSLANAQYALEELEETAKLFLTIKDRPVRPLTGKQVADLETRFGP